MDSSKNFLFYEDIFCVLAQSLPPPKNIYKP